MDSDKIHIGHVVRFDNIKKYGFVESEDGCVYFFSYDKKGQKELKRQGKINKIHKFCSGDKVEFQIRSSQIANHKLQAYNLIFIKNQRRERLLEEANNSSSLCGYLKLLDNQNFFVKHVSTYVFVAVEISEWERDFDEVYYNRIDQLVPFVLSDTRKIDKLKSSLVDVRYIEEYHELNKYIDHGTILDALVTGKNTRGMFLTILGGSMTGFATFSSSLNPLKGNLECFEKGEIINVKIKEIVNRTYVSLIIV